MTDDLEADTFGSACPHCGDVVLTRWVKGRGCIPSPDYVVVVTDQLHRGSGVYHAACWDQLVPPQ
jgi:hypothetical protein